MVKTGISAVGKVAANNPESDVLVKVYSSSEFLAKAVVKLESLTAYWSKGRVSNDRMK